MMDGNIKPILEIRHVNKSYGHNNVLSDINLSIERGDIYGVLGLSGAGKSTLVRCLNGLETIDSGEIIYSPDGENETILTRNHYNKSLLNKELKKCEKWLKLVYKLKNKNFGRKNEKKLAFCDKHITKISSYIDDYKNKLSFDEGEYAFEKPINVSKSCKSDIAMIFQNFNLLDQRSVLKNVELVGELHHEKNIKERAIQYLELVGLQDKINQFPSTLSGGEKQRVAIARALMSNPKILLCDEATSALDPETTLSILDLLKNINKTLGVTIIIIAHQMSVIEHVCNKVAIIDKSRITEQGSLSDVFLNPQSDIAKRLIYSNKINTSFSESGLIRFTFNGDTDTPLIANIVQDCNVLVSIVHADSKVVDGKVYGQMLIKAPSNQDEYEKLIKYLNIKNITFEEVK